MTHEIRNTHEARDDEPKTTADADLAFAAGAHFWPPRAVADLIDHALPDLRRARDRIQYVPHNQRIARDIASLEEMMMLLRTERHY